MLVSSDGLNRLLFWKWLYFSGARSRSESQSPYGALDTVHSVLSLTIYFYKIEFGKKFTCAKQKILDIYNINVFTGVRRGAQTFLISYVHISASTQADWIHEIWSILRMHGLNSDLTLRFQFINPIINSRLLLRSATFYSKFPFFLSRANNTNVIDSPYTAAQFQPNNCSNSGWKEACDCDSNISVWFASISLRANIRFYLRFFLIVFDFILWVPTFTIGYIDTLRMVFVQM